MLDMWPPAEGKGCQTQRIVEETTMGVSHFFDHFEQKQMREKRKKKTCFSLENKGKLAWQTAERPNKGQGRSKIVTRKLCAVL